MRCEHDQPHHRAGRQTDGAPVARHPNVAPRPPARPGGTLHSGSRPARPTRSIQAHPLDPTTLVRHADHAIAHPATAPHAVWPFGTRLRWSVGAGTRRATHTAHRTDAARPPGQLPCEPGKRSPHRTARGGAARHLLRLVPPVRHALGLHRPAVRRPVEGMTLDRTDSPRQRCSIRPDRFPLDSAALHPSFHVEHQGRQATGAGRSPGASVRWGPALGGVAAPGTRPLRTVDACPASSTRSSPARRTTTSGSVGPLGLSRAAHRPQPRSRSPHRHADGRRAPNRVRAHRGMPSPSTGPH